MGHIQGASRKLVARVRRLQGQLEAVVRGLESGEECSRILQTAAACRGAFSGLFLELLEDHIRTHVAGATSLPRARKETDELRAILRSYLK